MWNFWQVFFSLSRLKWVCRRRCELIHSFIHSHTYIFCSCVTDFLLLGLLMIVIFIIREIRSPLFSASSFFRFFVEIELRFLVGDRAKHCVLRIFILYNINISCTRKKRKFVNATLYEKVCIRCVYVVELEVDVCGKIRFEFLKFCNQTE